jgi:tRNA (guanine37-N1)-methyltransferase
MIFDVLTLFPEMFTSFIEAGIVNRARKKELMKIRLHNIRDYARDKHRQVDDYTFGGGPGMVMKPKPLYDALTDVMAGENPPVIYFTPQGRVLNQDIVNRYVGKERIIILCGHYKEIDQRIRDMLVTDEISIGDYVLSGGELPAMVMIDSVTRMIDGVLNDMESALSDSHQGRGLGSPYYTRPAVFKGVSAPEVLLSGNHKEIEKWRQKKSEELTKERRPDLCERSSK